ncbi:hypothetical protein C8R47DRAFT_1213193 [Mycena vitilis]|nr:hypothetical protein C8R47DRAFT_1213193 [Mycena vitilis]
MTPLETQVVRTGGEEEEGEAAAMWSQDTRGWPEELRDIFGGCARGKVWGGVVWQECVTELIELERARGFRAKGLLLAPRTRATRPCEIEGFMKDGRKWDLPWPVTTEVGPRSEEATFAARWWVWWDLIQAKSRKAGQSPETVPCAEWEDVGMMTGRNGLLLYVGALLWWGEAASASPNAELLVEWRVAVEDVRAVIASARKTVPEENGKKKAKGKGVGPVAKKTSAPTAGTKRKRVSTARTQEKENAPLNKRARRS